MLTQLSIKNYALIDDVNVSFDSGFTTITGETGAGKSILLGALALVLGKRADLSTLKNKAEKCIVEAEFSLVSYELKSFFEENDLDYEEHSIMRREILPSGKSRAFINDSPVNLDVLSSLGSQLVDVHSQHQTLQMTQNDFQLRVIDALAKNKSTLDSYIKQLVKLKAAERRLQELEAFQANATKELDYNRFLLNELEATNLEPDMLGALQEEQEQLGNVEAILESLGSAHQQLSDENIGVQTQLTAIKQALGRLVNYGKRYQTLFDRASSVVIEVQDIAAELEHLSNEVEANPKRFEEVNEQLFSIQNLLKKHQLTTVEDLIALQKELSEKVDDATNIDSKINAQRLEVDGHLKALTDLAMQLRQARKAVIPNFEKTLESRLANLGMPSATFKIKLNETEDFTKTGKDELEFLFSANKGSDFGILRKVASGGELSRIMLVIKSILAEYDQLPTLMFDEIDTGVSGEISGKMGTIMKKMGRHMQVFAITHLPQVAALGEHQFKVYKEEGAQSTFTEMKQLNTDERIVELAEMLGGKSHSEAAVAHARELLGAE